MKHRRNNMALLVALVLTGVSARSAGDNELCFNQEVHSDFLNLGEGREAIIEPGSELMVLDVYWLPDTSSGGAGCQIRGCRSDELMLIVVRNDGFDFITATTENNRSSEITQYYDYVDSDEDTMTFAVPYSPNYVNPTLYFSGVFAQTRPATRTMPVAVSCHDVRDLPQEWCEDPLDDDGPGD